MARPKSFNKEQVLEAAMKVFWKQGFDATSMKDLEFATQLTPGSIYHEFGSKVGLFEHALNYYVDAVMQYRVHRYLVKSEEPVQCIRDFVVSSFKGVPKEVEGDACMLVNTATELGVSNVAISRVVKRGFSVIERGLHKQLLLAQSAKKVRADLDCEVAARQLVFLMSGLLVASKNQSNTQNNILSLETTVDFTLSAYQ